MMYIPKKGDHVRIKYLDRHFEIDCLVEAVDNHSSELYRLIHVKNRTGSTLPFVFDFECQIWFDNVLNEEVKITKIEEEEN